MLKASILAVVIALTAAPAFVPAPAAAAQSTPAASVARMRDVITNLHLVDILVFGARKGATSSQEYAALSPADQKRMMEAIDQVIDTRRPELVTAMAQDNAVNYSSEQLDQLLALSRIQYTQDLVMAGADPSLAKPDASGMTEDERKLFMDLIAQPWVQTFFAGFDYSSAEPVLLDALTAALTPIGKQ